MLVLSRKTNESIIVNACKPDGTRVFIEIKIVELRGDKVRLGIIAPKEITVHRAEVQQLAMQRGQLE